MKLALTAALALLPMPAHAATVLDSDSARSLTASVTCVVAGEQPGAIVVAGVGTSANQYTIVHCTAYQNGVKIVELHAKRLGPANTLAAPKQVGAGTITVYASTS